MRLYYMDSPEIGKSECIRGAMLFLEEVFGLSGKTALISGAGGTLCGEIAGGYVRAGANVVLCGRHQETLDAKVREITEQIGSSSNMATVEADLTQESQVRRALEDSISKFGRIDILVNGVGGSSIRCPFVDIDVQEFESTLRLNLLAGCILPAKHAVRYWMANGIKGAIINIASMGAFNPLSGAWAYSSAKAAVVNQTMAQAKEFAPHGIRANAIAPGFFVGKQNRRLLLNEDGTLTQRGMDVIHHTPMGRFGEPGDLVAAAIFLAGDGARFISGVTLPVDGAYLCHNI